MRSSKSFTAAACAKLGPIVGVSESEKAKATAAIFSELNTWAGDNLPMGAGVEATEKQLRVGMKVVKKRFKDDPALSQAYGFVDPVTILTVISALLSIGNWLWRWWRGDL